MGGEGEGVQRATADFVRFHCPLEAANKTSLGVVTNPITQTIQGESIKLPLGEVYVRISWRDAAQ